MINGIRVISVLWILFHLMNAGSAYSQVKEKYLEGYSNEIKGEILRYHSPIPEAKNSLLVRSVDENLFIEWEMAAIPEDWKSENATFVWLGGIDVNEDSHQFKLFVNNKHLFTLKNPLNNSDPDWKMETSDGEILSYKNVLIDRHNDQMGFYFLTLPVGQYPVGKPIQIKVQGESSDSQSWYMTFRYGLVQKVTLTGEPAVIREGQDQFQWLRLDIIHIHNKGKVDVSIAGEKITKELQLGLNRFRVKVPRVINEKEFPVEVRIDGQIVAEQNYLFKPVEEKIIYLMHHSHNDIGYTHVQNEVEQAQWSFLEQCIELAKESKDNPEGSQFKWNVEVMWAVESYIENAPQEKKEAFIDAVQKGWIELDGLFGNELTGLCRPEELMQLMEASRKVGQLCEVPVEAAMISDVPGYTWGLIPAMAKYGIKYFSIGTNHFHRIGDIIETWGDRPFYWESPSGKEKVLCWLHEKGYAFFHTGLGYSKLETKLKPEAIFEYLEQLENRNYPYDIIPFRYNIGSDNGPPDPDLAETVKKWNELYVTPQLRISTVTEVFRDFEDKHGDEIPVYRGDLTPYWEDGAASSALETAINRETAEKLVQAELLWTLNGSKPFPADEFAEAWRNVLLYDEHTWGSWNSISEPEADFTLQQWKIKQSFATDARELTEKLLTSALNDPPNPEETSSFIDVYNTASWKRSDLILLPEGMDYKGLVVKNKSGDIIASQLLSSGELAFVAKDVPPLGSKRFHLAKGDQNSNSSLSVGNNTISNGNIEVELDPGSGVIKTLTKAGIPVNLAETEDNSGLNEYFYVKGRDPANRFKSGMGRLNIKENGPVLVSLLHESDAPGCKKLTREIRLLNGIDRIDIINSVDKKNIYNQEGVHFGFPFNIPDGGIHVDIAWGIYTPDEDQLPGSCKNYFTVQRWVDVSNNDYGVTFVTPDAPLVELGQITTDPLAYGWVKEIEKNQTIYSYVMNNYWETNYKASQEGEVNFRYSLFPHLSPDPVIAEKKGIEICQPLIAVFSDGKNEVMEPFLRINSPEVIITSVKPSDNNQATMVRLFNAGAEPVVLDLEWTDKPRMVSLSSPLQEKGEKLSKDYELAPWEILTLRVSMDD